MGLTDTNLNERVPPHDEKAEVAALGSMLIDPKAAEIVIDLLVKDDFYLPRHRTLFVALSSVFNAHGQIDEVTAVAALPSATYEDKDYIGRLILDCPTAANCEEYCAVVKKHSRARKLLEHAAKVVRSIEVQDNRGVEGAIEDAEASLAAVRGDPASTDKKVNWQNLLDYDNDNDANNVIGNCWLVKGAGMVLAAQTGIGKSSFLLQCSGFWALGQAPFGRMFPSKPLRILIIQAENSVSDLGRMIKGITAGNNWHSFASQLSENITIIKCSDKTGPAFCSYLRSLIRSIQPDLVWIDPLLAYLGGDVSSQKDCSAFLRNGVEPILEESGVVCCIAHHTPKPSRDPRARNAYSGGDLSYLGMGSVEIPNWSRAVCAFTQIDPGVYELFGPKRGYEGGLSESLILHHSDIKDSKDRREICWYKSDDPRTADDSDQIQAVLAEIPTDGLRSKDLIAVVKRIYGVKDAKAYQLLKSLKSAGRIVFFASTGFYTAVRV